MLVDCNGCGASLMIVDTTRFVTCTRCHKRLSVQRSDAAIYTEVIGGAETEASARAGVETEPVVPVAPTAAGGESILRIIVGSVLVVSDVFWWLTDPTLQSFYMRVALLAAGAWLILSGAWKAIANTRARLRR